VGLREGGGEQRGTLEEVRERKGEDRVSEVRGVDAVIVELLQREAVEGGVGLHPVPHDIAQRDRGQRVVLCELVDHVLVRAW